LILFLDFDGVLHPDAAYLEKGRPVLRAEGEFFMWAPYLVEALAEHPDVKIVLSTSWARSIGFSRAKGYLPEDLRKRVIGATWHSGMGKSEFGGWSHAASTWWDDASRYQQICRYVERARLDDWIAIDDDDEGWAKSAGHRLIRTDPDKGIADPEALALLHERILLCLEARQKQ